VLLFAKEEDDAELLLLLATEKAEDAPFPKPIVVVG
jgi:hypothetical protein